MSAHLIDGEFQSDKYPTTPRGKVPLSVKDKTAQDLLWAYAQRRRAVDAEFSDDLEVALRLAGFVPELHHAFAAGDYILLGQPIRGEDRIRTYLATVESAGLPAMVCLLVGCVIDEDDAGTSEAPV
jgi:hypothetical protein